MNFIKIILGITLLLLGLIIVFYALYSSYNIFTAKAAAPEIFKLEAREGAISPEGIQDIQAQLQKIIGEQLKGILPVDSLSTLLNLISWSIFSGILIFGGAQIAGLGVKLIK